jgi:hypothetical protein
MIILNVFHTRNIKLFAITRKIYKKIGFFFSRSLRKDNRRTMQNVHYQKNHQGRYEREENTGINLKADIIIIFEKASMTQKKAGL